jgi:CMP-N-acetylneuraminic acid synthetase
MLSVEDLMIAGSVSLRSAMERMTRNRVGVLFVCGDDALLEGAISDGDVRRALLQDTLMMSPVNKVMNPNPAAAATEEEARRLLVAHNLVAVPVLDREGRIIGAVVEGHDRMVVPMTLDGLWDEPAAAPAADAIALIPARGQSKRIPRKNLAEVGGKPLLQWTIEAARAAKRVKTILVSTDDLEIAAAAQKYGAQVPWLRPAELSTDTSPTIDTVIHALEWAVREVNPAPKVALLLEPTALFRHAQQIDDAVDLLMSSGADSVMSVSEVPHVFHPEELLRVEDGAIKPYPPNRSMGNRKLRGQQTPVYVANGLVYAFQVSTILGHRNLFGARTVPLITPFEEFIDVDTQADLELANLRFAHAHR